MTNWNAERLGLDILTRNVLVALGGTNLLGKANLNS